MTEPMKASRENAFNFCAATKHSNERSFKPKDGE